LVLIAKRKISVLPTPFTSLNLRNQARLFTELRLLQGTQISAEKSITMQGAQNYGKVLMLPQK